MNFRFIGMELIEVHEFTKRNKSSNRRQPRTLRSHPRKEGKNANTY